MKTLPGCWFEEIHLKSILPAFESNQMKGLCIFELCNKEEELLISNFKNLWCFLFFISKLPFRKSLWKETWIHSRAWWLRQRMGEGFERMCWVLWEECLSWWLFLLKFSFKASLWQHYPHSSVYSYSASFIQMRLAMVWTWNAPIGITFWFPFLQLVMLF